jgi:hypothetical protein
MELKPTGGYKTFHRLVQGDFAKIDGEVCAIANRPYTLASHPNHQTVAVLPPGSTGPGRTSSVYHRLTEVAMYAPLGAAAITVEPPTRVALLSTGVPPPPPLVLDGHQVEAWAWNRRTPAGGYLADGVALGYAPSKEPHAYAVWNVEHRDSTWAAYNGYYTAHAPLAWQEFAERARHSFYAPPGEVSHGDDCNH